MSRETESESGNRNWGTILAALAAMLIFATLVKVTIEYTQPPPLGAERAAERAKGLAEINTANAEALDTVGWVSPEKGIVRLPIAEAMKIAGRSGSDPAKARADLLSRLEKANAKLPEKPSPYE